MGRFIPAAPDCIKERSPKWKIDRVVIHCAESDTLNGTVSWFQKVGRSVPTATHFVIGPDGDTVQMVLESKKCLHAGSKTQPGWNDRSIGIELIGWTDKTTFPEVQLRAAASLVADICKRRGIPVDRTHIVGHGEIPGVDHHDPGTLFPWERFMEMVSA